MRRTVEDLKQETQALLDTTDVYKTDVDMLKHHVSSSFFDNLKTKRVYDELSDAEKTLSNEAPMELRHWFGKKWTNTLHEAPDTQTKREFLEFRDQWRPIHEGIQRLVERQIKGRKPKPKKVVATRTQLRGICACCYRQQAVKGDNIVAHGYTLDHGFQNGTCPGAGLPHFGTSAGRKHARDFTQQLLQQAEALDIRAEKLRAGEITPRDYKGRVIENPRQHHIDSAVASAESHARMIRRDCEKRAELDRNWRPTDPVEVEVEVTE